MEKIELYVIGLSSSVSQKGKNYALVLQEVNGQRKIPILIGSGEGQAIALVMEKLKAKRPITHDLFKTTIEALGARLVEVVIHSIEHGIFYSKLVLMNNLQALAVRFGCPIFSFDFVINEASVIEDTGKLVLKKGSFAEYTLQELEELLESILAKEDYESAARVRDVIERRKTAK